MDGLDLCQSLSCPVTFDKLFKLMCISFLKCIMKIITDNNNTSQDCFEGEMSRCTGRPPINSWDPGFMLHVCLLIL